MSRIVLAMSGGVDSSAAAHLLKEAGHEVIGVFMRHGEEAQEVCAADGPPGYKLPIFNPRSNHKQGCCSASDAEDARRVADRLDIPFYALNLQAEFKQIIDYFIDEYTRGRTPNPCVQCNNWLKFGKLFDYADSVGAEFVATGHYARVNGSAGASPSLLRGIDHAKDQSYVLFGIDRKLLSRMLLPVGGFRKPQIRELAAKIGLKVAEKKDSQEICFVTSGRHDEFVRQRRRGRDMAGEIITTDGHVVGKHPGIERFTIGQRKKLGVALGEPYFVVRIEPDSKRVVIGRHEELARTDLTAGDCNWLVDPPAGEFRCTAKIRYNTLPAAATAEALPDRRLRVAFENPRHGIAPGQAVVLYEGDVVLGGGWIECEGMSV
jgi:tRNA-uridine 2-sulfurtransferase